MKWVLLIAATAAVGVLMVGCGSRGVTHDAGGQPLTLGSVPWHDGETSTYEITDSRGNKAGTATIALARDGDVWLLTEVDKAVNQDQVVKLRIDAATLRPLGGEKALTNANGRATLTVTYEAGYVRVDGMVDDEYAGSVSEVPAGALDSDQLLVTLRALPFAEGYQGRAVVVIAQSSATIESMITVKGRERVEVPIGTLETWLVDLSIGQTTQRAWYELAIPHRLVKFDNGATTFALAALVE